MSWFPPVGGVGEAEQLQPGGQFTSQDYDLAPVSLSLPEDVVQREVGGTSSCKTRISGRYSGNQRRRKVGWETSEPRTTSRHLRGLVDDVASPGKPEQPH